jgi:hypothetical protein
MQYAVLLLSYVLLTLCAARAAPVRLARDLQATYRRARLLELQTNTYCTTPRASTSSADRESQPLKLHNRTCLINGRA